EQQAPSRLARQWAPSQQATTVGTGHQVSDCLARQRASGHRYDSGHWVTRHQVIWVLPAGTASSGKAVGTGSPGTGSSGSTAGIESTGLIGSSGWISSSC
ncbi:unnamed protein product, partial [Staurois parvus]